MIWTRKPWAGPNRPLFTDAQLAEALAEEPTQVAAARRLGVTPAAVCKRLARMRPKTDTSHKKESRA
jgi:predicted transcriptional regulator